MMAASAKFFVKPLDRVPGPERLPLRLGEGEEREQLVAVFSKTSHDARATVGPRSLERHVRAPRGVDTGCIRDAMNVIADLREGMLRGASPGCRR